MGLSFGLLTVSAAVATAVLFVAMPRVGTPQPMTLFLRFAAVAGVAAVGSSAMYFIYGAGGGILSLVLGDVAMVLSPSLLLVAIAVLDGRKARVTSLAVLVTTVAVAVVTATVPLPGSLAVKALVLALACGACAWVSLRSRIEPFGPVRLIAVTTAVFAVYCLGRVVAGAVAGWDSRLYRTVFSFAPATVLGALAVVLIGVAVIRLRLRPRPDLEPVLCPVGAAVVVGDWDLASAAYGPDRMRVLVDELRAAAHDIDPGANDVPRGVEIAATDPIAAVGERLREGYGWEPEQTILLVDGAATAAIRTQPSRTGRPRWWRPVRS